MAPRLGGELPPMGVTVKPVRKRPPMPRPVQVMSNLAAPYGSKGGMTPLRKPMPGISRRPTR